MQKVTSFPIHFFNTLSRTKEAFQSQKPGEVKLYTCGPTVYNYAHIGNLRTYIFEDLLRRTLKYFGYQVEQAMNLTDVDDKTIRGAINEGCSLDAFTQPYKEAFFADLKTLNIERVEHYPAATEYILEMIELIEQLMAKKAAYKGADGSIYFAISSFPNYGCLSHLKLDELQEGASKRVHADEYDKENVSDFVLWKAYDESRDGDIFWESPFGKGRPGWHLECSCMAMRLLGESLDIHCGGVDNIFPHHENEIAQSESCTGKPFCRYWLHSEHLVVDNKKMSKSLGNFYTLKDLLAKGYTGRQVRYLLLQTHYRTPLNFTLQGLQASISSLDRLDAFYLRLENAPKKAQNVADSELVIRLEKAGDEFKKALADDLNISVALSVVFSLLRELNAFLDDHTLSQLDYENIQHCWKDFDHVLGVLEPEKQVESIPQQLQQALEDRCLARQNKDWAKADELRDFIYEQGYSIEDGPKGTFLKKIQAGR